uniref:Uncharacterized protein n=1 Tax=viral metagenome TaxID=1070528 RepID=A0A6C0B8W7_9ZZZZ
MSYVLCSKLPEYVVDHVKLYTGEGMWLNNRYINIRRINRNDSRYAMLKKMPKIRQVSNFYGVIEHRMRGCVWFKIPEKKKHIVLTVRYCKYYGQHHTENYHWEMYANNEHIMFPIP